MKTIILGSVSVLAVLAATTAMAQSTEPAPAQATAGAQATVPDDTVVSEVVVSGYRAAMAKAATIKRDSVNVVDSIVADDIGKFPDRTVAAALQRVPGVQVTVGDNNEIVNPLIRGLPDILTTLDGREIFTGVGRGFSYQDLPAEALAGADVYKSSTADLIEGGVAGAVNLRLHKPFDFPGFKVAANARGIYARNADHVSPVLGALISDRFETGAGEIGVLVDLSYAQNRFDRPVAFNCDFRGNPAGAPGIVAPTCLGGVENEGTYKRPQANAALQWRPNESTELYVNGLYTAYRAKTANYFLIDDIFGGTFSNVVSSGDCRDYQTNGIGFYDPAGATQSLCTPVSFTSTNHGGFTSTQAHHDRTDIYVLSGGGKWTSGPLSLAADVSYQHSLVRNQNFILDITKVGGGITTVVSDINAAGGPVYADTVNGLSDPANFGLSPLNQDNIRDTGEEFSVKGDGEYKFDGLIEKVQFGARYADHSAHHQQSLGGTCGTVCGTLLTNVPFLGSDFLTHASGIPSVNDGVGVVVPDQDRLRDPKLQDQLRAYYGLASGFPDFTPDRAFEASEKTYAGYLQAGYRIPLGGDLTVDGVIGGRLTKTDRTIKGAAFVTPAATPSNPTPAPVLTPSSASTSDQDFLPNASARLKFGNGLQARFNYARTIARPSFGDLNPGLSYLISTNSLILPAGSGGNPDLRPQRSDGYDATLEYYFQSNGYVAIGAYAKDIKDRVIRQSQVETINGFDYNITRPRNVGSVSVKGIELSGQAFLDFLPGAWSGLGVLGNFTLSDSEVKTAGDPLEGRVLQGVSKYNYNVGALYEKYGLTARVVYTHRSKYYDENYGGTTVRPSGQPLVLNMVRPSGRLDASIGYEVRPGVTISADATNLTHAKYRSYYGLPEFPRDKRYDDATYSLGVSAQF